MPPSGSEAFAKIPLVFEHRFLEGFLEMLCFPLNFLALEGCDELQGSYKSVFCAKGATKRFD